jgi:hypothetical protein
MAASDIMAILCDIELVMVCCHHTLHYGFLFTKPTKTMLTFVKMMDIKMYMNKSLANDALREWIIKHVSHHIIGIPSWFQNHQLNRIPSQLYRG